MPAPRGDDRAARAERLAQSIIKGAPDMSLVAPGFEYEQHFGNTAGLYAGEAGLRRWIESFYDVWDRASMAVERVREAQERLALDIHVQVRARQTRIEVELRATQVVLFAADGSIARMDAFNEPDEAERALRGEVRGKQG